MAILVLFLTILLLVFMIIFWVKMEIAYTIQKRWCSDIYQNIMYGDKSLDWSDKPAYYQTLLNPFVWKYKSLKGKQK